MIEDSSNFRYTRNDPVPENGLFSLISKVDGIANTLFSGSLSTPVKRKIPQTSGLAPPNKIPRTPNLPTLITGEAKIASSSSFFVQDSSLGANQNQKKTPFLSAWEIVECPTFYRCTQKAPGSEIYKLNLQQYPVLQSTFNQIRSEIFQKTSTRKFLEELGFILEENPKALCFPKKDQLIQKLKAYRENNPDFPDLTITEVDEILSTEEFMELVLLNDLIYSKPPDIIHDITYHVIPLLLRIHQNPTLYRHFKMEIASLSRYLMGEFEKAETNFEEFIAPVNEFLVKKEITEKISFEDWNLIKDLLKYSLSASLDIATSDDTPFDECLNIKNYFLDLQISILKESPNWQSAWTKELGLQGNNLDRVIEIIQKKPLKQLLFLLYAQNSLIQAKAYLRQFEDKLQEASRDPTAFLKLLNGKLESFGQEPLDPVFCNLLIIELDSPSDKTFLDTIKERFLYKNVLPSDKQIINTLLLSLKKKCEVFLESDSLKLKRSLVSFCLLADIPAKF